MKRWRVAIETALAVAVIVVLKVGIEALSLDFIALSPLYTSVVAGGIFVIGLLVAGTLADYKGWQAMHEDRPRLRPLLPSPIYASLSPSRLRNTSRIVRRSASA